MTSSGSRPPDSSHTSHRFTRWRVTSKFGFARLTPARSSMNTREALYRGPPIASQYSWKDTRYAVGLRCPASHRTPVTDATRPGRRSRPRMSIKGSVWIGRIGIVTTPFAAGFGSGSHIPFFSRSNWSRAPSVSKKIGRPSWPHAWHTYDRLSLSIPAIGPITKSLGWTWLLPQRAHAAKSVGPKRPAIRSASFDANHFHAFANPVRRKVHAAGTPALRHDLLDHLLTEHLELRFLPGARHSGPPASYSQRTDKACGGRLCCSYPRQKESSIRQRHMPGRKHAFTPETQTRAGPVVRSVRPCDAGLLARQAGRLRVRARRRVPEPVPGRGVLRPACEVVESRAGGDERSPRPGPRRGLRTGPPCPLSPAETTSCGGDRRLANAGGARPNPRGRGSLPGECAAAAAGAGDVRHDHPHGEQPRPRRGRPADATIPARRAADFDGPRAPHRQHPDPGDVDSTAPALREMEHRTGPPTRTPHVARTVQGSRRRLVRPPLAFAG